MPAVSKQQTARALGRVRVQEKKLQRTIGHAIEGKRVQVGGVIRKATASVLQEIQRKSPVDTGRFRGGWSPFLIALGRKQYMRGRGGVHVLEGIMASDYDDQSERVDRPFVRITNGVPYGPELEAGKSRQAGAGFVAESLARMSSHIRKAARE